MKSYFSPLKKIKNSITLVFSNGFFEILIKNLLFLKNINALGTGPEIPLIIINFYIN